MRPLFADAAYYIALLSARDALHRAALRLKDEFKDRVIFTHEGVLAEVLAHVSRMGPRMREEAAGLVRNLQLDPRVIVLPVTHELFEAGVELYGSRLDKSYSVIDCISMRICQEVGIQDVITHDRHFQQEGLTILL